MDKETLINATEQQPGYTNLAQTQKDAMNNAQQSQSSLAVQDSFPQPTPSQYLHQNTNNSHKSGEDPTTPKKTNPAVTVGAKGKGKMPAQKKIKVIEEVDGEEEQAVEPVEQEEEEEEESYLYHKRVVIRDPCYPAKDYVKEVVVKNGEHIKKDLMNDFTTYGERNISQEIGSDVLKQTAVAVALCPGERNVSDFSESTYANALFVDRVVRLYPNTYPIKSVAMVNNIDILAAFKWIHTIANCTDFEDYIKVVIGSGLMNSRHRIKGYSSLLFTDFILRRLSLNFATFFTKSDLSSQIIKSKDDDINFDLLFTQMLNEQPVDKAEEVEDVFNF